MKGKGLIIAIDGPSGAGKSSLTRLLSEKLGYLHIDTGAMYRAVALEIKENAIDPADESALSCLLENLSLSFGEVDGEQHILSNNRDVSANIRSPEISMLTSKISAIPLVRKKLTAFQQLLGKKGAVVLEGRDIGTVVFPDADVKFFLSASPEERAARRCRELKANGVDVTYEETLKQVHERDRQDAGREIAPLMIPENAVVIDSTSKSMEQVLSEMIELVRENESLRLSSGKTGK